MGHTRHFSDPYERRKVYQGREPERGTLRDCPARKLAYPTGRVAKSIAAQNFKRDGPVLYTYKCPHCRQFHLTKQPQ